MNEGSVLGFFCPASVPFAVTVPAVECSSLWLEPASAHFVSMLQHGWTRARGPGMTLSGVNSMSDQVQTQGLRLWSHQPYTSLEHCRNPNQHLPRSRFYTGFGRACLTGGKQYPEQKTPGTKSHFLGLKYSNQSR